MYCSVLEIQRRKWTFGASVAVLALAAALSRASLPVAAQSSAPPSPCPIVDLGNPSPGDSLPEGKYIVSGTAFTPNTTDGTSGIARIDFFLGNRDAGGPIVGTTVTGTGPSGGVGSFQSEVTIPDINAQTFTAYAYAANSPGVTSVTIPVRVGPETKSAATTPTPVPATVFASSGCVAAAAITEPTTSGAAPSAPIVAVQPVGGPVLLLGNPSSGDVVSHGDYLVSGLAFDPAASDGSGISRVDFFLDNRDFGGQFLGSAIPGVSIPAHPRFFSGRITFPTDVSGAHQFNAYALPRASNMATVVSVPIFVGTPPTATPRTAP